MKIELRNKHTLWIPLIVGIFILAGFFLHTTGINPRNIKEWHIIPRVAVFLVTKDADLAVEIGNFYFNEHNYGNGFYDTEKAKFYFKEALSSDPHIPYALHQLARIDFIQGNFLQALEEINRQIEIHGNNFPSSYYVRGLIYGYDKQFKKSEEDFLTFLELDKTSWAANNDLAWVYFQQGMYEKSEEFARKGLGYNPSNSWLLTMLGVSLLNLDRKDEAGEVFTQALKEARKLTEEDWHNTYPGNDPRYAAPGIVAMISAIESNLKLAVD